MGEKSRGVSPFITTMWSLNLHQDKNSLYPPHTYNPSSSSLKSNLYSNLLHSEDLVASHRYLPNEHHRIVASVALDYPRNLARCPQRIVIPTSVSSEPMFSRDSSTDQNSSLEGTLDHNVGCQNLSCKNSRRWTVGGSARNGLASPDMRTPSDIFCNINLAMDKSSASGMSALPHLTNPSCKYSLFLQPCSENDNLVVNLNHSSELQNEQQLLSTPRNKEISSDVGTHSHASMGQCLSQGLLFNNFAQPSCLRPLTSHNRFDEHQILSTDNSIHDRYVSVEERGSSNLNCPSETKTIKLGKKPIEPFEASISPYNPPQDVLISGIKEDKMMACLSETKHKEIERVLLLYEHVKICQVAGKECLEPRCMESKKAFSHVLNCRDCSCRSRCYRYVQLIHHYKECCNIDCFICGSARRKLNEDFQKSNAAADWEAALHMIEPIEDEQPMAKRIRASHEAYPASEQKKNFKLTANCSLQSPQVLAQPDHGQIRSLDSETDTCQQLLEQSKSSASTEFANICNRSNKDEELKVEMKMEVSLPSPPAEGGGHSLQENISGNEFPTARMDVRCKINSLAARSISVSEKEDRKKYVASLLHTFTSHQIREHIKSLGMDQDKSKADNGKIKSDDLANMNLCSLCGTDKLLFEPLPKFCASCLKLINPKGVYYSVRSDSCPDHEDNAKIFFCGKCYGSSGESIKFGGKSFRKANLERSWNYAADAEPEWFVQCDKCKAWQHTICALFNKERKEELQGEYTCANCHLQELESGKCQPLQQNLVLGAKDLPKTALSNHIEKWVFNRLKQEREQRACSLGKSTVEVPTAEGLAIRVVSSINKKSEVNPLFHETFVDENYPSEFPYKSKVILLFQNIEGSDVCLFAMYVQEYGSECPQPNQRQLCISYIDSVKFFRPEVKAVTGEALRTFVYHEILIGYLDYSKKRGFASCYFWSCPPEREDYYIFYCHPKTQKSPKPDKLREWYQAMIRKAMKESIVLEKTNLHEHFFVLASECKAKITAARLPYFDSDYWPGQAELLLKKDNENDLQAKGTKAAIERALRAAKRDASTGNAKDILLMYQLGEKFQKMKEDLIVVLLQPECRHCCQPMVCGKQWFCNTCKNFQLCEKCYDKELKLEKKEMHPVTTREKHSFQLVEVGTIGDTADKDEIMKNDYFDMRTELLSFCQSKHYQFDSLRRAKHSTMMILYHLHRSLNLLSSCASCHCDVITGDSWHCSSCSGYVICASCFHEQGSSLHEHKLISHPTSSNRVLAGKEGNSELKKQLLDVLLHSSKCAGCTDPGCQGMKRLFHHCKNCTTRQRGGCLYCRKVWSLLLAHAHACRELDCCVPRCSDLKNWEAQEKPLPPQKPVKDKTSQQEGEVSEQHT